MTKEQEPITWIVGKDNCQVAVRNMPIDKMQKICAIIGEEGQQPCEDCVKRESVLDLAKKGVLISNGSYESVCKAINELPPVTPRTNLAESSQDCISREAVKKLKKYRFSYDTNTTIPKSDIFVKIADIEQLPPVTPKAEKRGIEMTSDEKMYYIETLELIRFRSEERGWDGEVEDE